MRTGVIQPLPGIGDMVWFLPALRTLAASSPNGKVTLFTRASCQPLSLFKNEPMIEEVVILPRNKRGGLSALTNLWGTWKALMKVRPDKLYILHHSPRYKQAAKLAGIKEVVAYPPLTDKTFIDGWVRSRAFLDTIGLPVADPTPHLSVAEDTKALVQERFAAHPRPWIVMSAGASEPVRRWRPEFFAQLAEALAAGTGGTIFLIGAKSDAEIVARVQADCAEKQRVIPVVGRPLDEVMALMAVADCMVGNDSGPPNLSAAMGCRTYSLSGRVIPPIHSPLLIPIGPPPGEDVNAIPVAQVVETVLAGF